MSGESKTQKAQRIQRELNELQEELQARAVAYRAAADPVISVLGAVMAFVKSATPSQFDLQSGKALSRYVWGHSLNMGQGNQKDITPQELATELREAAEALPDLSVSLVALADMLNEDYGVGD